MARNEHKRQQKLMKKQRRTNVIKKERNKSLNVSNRELIVAAAKSPWIGCYVSGESGMYSVFAIRQTRRGPAASVFLVDMFCLGIKDSFFIKDFDMEAFRERRADLETDSVPPSHALKRLDDAIEYARGIGFEPHLDAGKCKLIFGDTDAAECTEEFTFGKDGKPFYSSGPHDDREKQTHIVETLSKLGHGNYGIMLGESAMGFGDDQFYINDRVVQFHEGQDNDEDYDDEEFDDELDEEQSMGSDTIDAVEVRPTN